MKRRNLLIGFGAAAGTSMALGSGAFSTVEANRRAEINVAGDAGGYLSLRPGDQHGEYVDQSGGEVVLDFGDNGNGSGVTTGSTYTFDGTLRLQNQGTNPAYIWTTAEAAAFEDDAFYLYVDGDRSTPFSEANAIQVDVGDSLSLGVYLDTSEVSTDSYDADLTIHGAEERPTGGEDEEDDSEDGESAPEEPIDSLVFDSTASQLNADEEPLTDESLVAVWTAETATNEDQDGNGDAVFYPDDADIPLVSSDGGVVGFGAPIVQNGTEFGSGNEEFVLNVLDAEADGPAVAFDDGHGQFYDSNSFSQFLGYAGSNGYETDATTDLTGALPDADAAIITSPSDAFTQPELDALGSFVDDGGALLLFDQSDFDNFDATDNLNEIASSLGLGFRFNDDQVIDEQNNDGIGYVPTTDRFNADAFDYFADRTGIVPPDLEKGQQYEVDVVSVTDGDTADVRFANGYVDEVRILGVDTPETGSTEERIEEFEGITDGETLRDEADAASAYAEDLLADETVTLSFDDNEPLRGNYGRVLGYLELPNGDVYNERLIEDGYARLYSSGFGEHDAYWDHERAARDAGQNLWSISDPSAVPESDDSAVDSLFFPEPVAVSGGTTVVSSEGDDPLVALDDDAGVAVLGGPIVDEGFESGEGGPGIDGYGQYPFLTNVIDRLAGGIDGRVLIDGGHGQFNAGFSIAAEDAAYYQRYLEGQSTAALDSIAFQPTNDLLDDNGPALLDGDDRAASALVVSTPTDELSADERDRIATFADAGGAVVLLGSAADTDALGNFDPLLADLDADVGFTTTAVTDADSNLGGASNPATSNFAGGTELFTPFSASTDGGNDDGATPSVEITELDDSAEYVLIENTGSSPVDVGGWTLSDETSKTFTFPSSTLAAGETAVVTTNQTGANEAPAADYSFNWDEGYVWNGDGDTATLVDADGETVDSYSY
ncbi:lamin tail domain-containing protein [Halolamina sp. CBA1230]|uniref:lamin tail domain-containing protein n=1 Tax=Halolamina sp. CBA1230 TaxID=1853690 RepID=UPI0009A24607|nr:DUF4350 domain-containing protein [Halolamina sp. CBA1230]QKY19511.1 lamin tail domain-containing protein [Halolamina sp. CBA1230]